MGAALPLWGLSVAWVNIFELGECEVQIVDQWDGSIVPEVDWPNLGVTSVEVAPDGLITVTGDLDHEIRVQVAPAFAPLTARVRTSAFVDEGGLLFSTYVRNDADPVQEVEFDGAPYSPDPAEMNDGEIEWSVAGVLHMAGGDG